VHDAAGEVNLEGETGYNVDLDRPGELAERLILLLRDRDHAAALGRAGLRRWADHFRYRHFRARFGPLLGELLAS
jgi:phosphatidylinositol alpha-1,6-mannosyltransferase